ncbi:hypothetical protein Trydic_g9473 [Trypoxylus dichotomus]
MDRIEDNFPSIKQLVEFTDIKPEYPDNEHLKCTFKSLNYRSQEGDRVAIYKLGWSMVKEYIVFEWVPVRNAEENSVIFNQSVLPKNSTDMFQLCYISSQNETYGVSEPFQFTNPSMKLSSLDCIRSFNSDSDYLSLSYEREMLKLKEENKFFRDKLQIFMSMLINTQTLLCQQQKEINRLKERYEGLERSISVDLKDSLCNNRNSNVKTLGTLICTTDFDIGELETLPPFPFSK